MNKNYIYFNTESKESAERSAKKFLKKGYKITFEINCIIVEKKML